MSKIGWGVGGKRGKQTFLTKDEVKCPGRGSNQRDAGHGAVQHALLLAGLASLGPRVLH